MQTATKIASLKLVKTPSDGSGTFEAIVAGWEIDHDHERFERKASTTRSTPRRRSPSSTTTSPQPPIPARPSGWCSPDRPMKVCASSASST